MPESFEHLLELYLDGQLPAEQRADFERMAADRPAIQARIRLQEEIDTALRQALRPPSFESVFAEQQVGANGKSDAVAIAPPPSTPLFRRILGIAAFIAIGAVAAWRIAAFINTPGPVHYPPQAWRSLEQVYRDKLADGYRVDWTCKDDTEFRDTFARRLGQPMLLASIPPNVQSLGLGYCNSISDKTIYLLTRVDGQEVIVFVDRASADKNPQPAVDGLQVFRRQVDDLVLYELSPMEGPRVLELFYKP